MQVKPHNIFPEQLLAGMLVLKLEAAASKKGRKNCVDPSQLGNSCVSITLCLLPAPGMCPQELCVCMNKPRAPLHTEIQISAPQNLRGVPLCVP